MTNSPALDAWPVNPFAAGDPVWENGRFFGRSEIVGRIVRAAEGDSPSKFIIDGPRRIGKTSVALRAYHALQRHNPCVYLDLLPVREGRRAWAPRELGRVILQELVAELESQTQQPEDSLPRESTPRRFRERVLPGIHRALGERRLIIFLDELEVVEEADPDSVLDVLSAFDPSLLARGPRPLLVIVWGRSSGLPSTSELKRRLRGSESVSLGSLDPQDAEAFVTMPVSGCYGYERKGLERILHLSDRQPLYLAALAAEIYDSRRATRTTSDVGRDEVDAARAPALRRIHYGIEHAWGLLEAEQQILAHAFATVARRQGTRELVEIARAEQLLRELRYAIDRDLLDELLGGLVENLVLEGGASGYRVRAPLLEDWIAELHFDELLRHAAAEDPRASAAFRRGRACRDRGQIQGALEAFVEAAEANPHLWQASLEAARVEAELGEMDQALSRLRVLNKHRPRNVDVERLLCDLLVRRAKAADAAGLGAESWLDEVRGIDPSFAHTPEAERLAGQLELRQWERELRASHPSVWADASRRLAERAPSSWWRGAVAVYCDWLREARTTEHGDSFALRLVREVFPLLIESAPPEDLGASALHDLEMLEARLGLPEELRRKLRELRRELGGEVERDDARDPERDIRVAWELTVDLLRWALPLELDRHEDRIPAALLESFGLRAPARQAALLDELCRRVLPMRFPRALEEAPGDAAVILRFLAGARDQAAVKRCWQALEEDVLAVDADHDQRVLRLFQHGPDIYALLLDADRELTKDELLARKKEALGQIEVLFERLHAPRDPRPDGTSPKQWDLILAVPRAIPEWLRLLARLESADPERARALEHRLEAPAEPGPRPSSKVAVERSPVQLEEIQALIGPEYTEITPLPFEVPGAHPDDIRLYKAMRDGEWEAVRIYSLERRSPAERRFLHWLWKNEHRALYNVSTRWTGRAIAKLRWATFLEDKGVLILVTEFMGDHSLRQHLAKGRTGILAQRGPDLWRHLHALIEAVSALHRAGYLHRAIRPESIYLDRLGENLTHKPWLKLGNLEWSVYLQALTTAAPARRRHFDHYLAPEVLAARFHIPGGGGEGFSSDIYSLGLVLFECLVRPLESKELRQFYDVIAYDRDQHLTWVERLRREAQQTYQKKDLGSEELSLLLELLVADMNQRTPDLDRACALSATLALRSTSLGEQIAGQRLIVATTLGRDTDASIFRFIGRQIDISAVHTSGEMKALLEAELVGAKVYVNPSSDSEPLLIFGKRVAFTVTPLRLGGTVYRRLGFLKVAVEHEAPKQHALAALDSGVEVLNLSQTMDVTTLLGRGGSWEDLFQLAERRFDGLGPDQRRFQKALELSVELQRDLWTEEVYPYAIVSAPEAPLGGQSTNSVVIRERAEVASGARSTSLLRFVAQHLDREIPWFDLNRSHDPMASFADRPRWFLVDTDEDAGTVRLERRNSVDAEPPPKEGYLRPWNLAATRVLYSRWRELIRFVGDDPFLIQAVTAPWAIAQDLRRPERELFNKGLDEDKRLLVHQIRNRRPLFCVQGPPGTGKTTLVTEVVRQLLEENPSARILLTSQSHEPINNLVRLVKESLKERPAETPPLAVRIQAEERLDASRYSEEATQIGREFHPSAIAKTLLEAAERWLPGEGTVTAELARKWRQHLAMQRHAGLSATLEQRVIDAANLVYVTANDRHITRFRDDAFDFVIFEEAAKAYAIEVLGPMRLARRWLLIGDFAQLPPYNIQDFEKALEHRIQAFVNEGEHERAPAARPSRNSAEPIPVPSLPEDMFGFENLEQLRVAVMAQAKFFEAMYKRGNQVHPSPLSGRLALQWRMHPKIGALVREVFYPFMRDGDPDELRRSHRHSVDKPNALREQQLVWLDIPPAAVEPLAEEQPGAGGGYTNGYEGRALLGLLKLLVPGGRKSRLKTALLTPYRAQMAVLKRLFATWSHPVTGPLADRVFTVDSFQGRQADLVAISLVRNNRAIVERQGIGFLSDMGRSTVMFSRAERLLVVVGSSEHFRRFQNSWVNQVFEHIRLHGVVLKGDEFVREVDEHNMRLRRELFQQRAKR
ncbi:AAA domain-containing protein [Sorangium sp. So ce216]